LHLWGEIAIVTQILSFYLAELFTPNFNLQQAIEQGNDAIGLFLFIVSISLGILIAGCLTY
jgi:putative membrane protein